MFKEKIIQLIDSFIRVPAIGLDISDTSIKYMRLRSHDIFEPLMYGEITLPEGLIVDGEIKKEDETAALLREWHVREKKKLGSSLAIVSLPEEKSFLRIIQLPKVKRDEVKSAIVWEIEANIPLPVADLIYDYEIVDPLKNSLDHLDVAITAFPKVVVASYVRMLQRAGFQPIAMELESQASVRAIIKHVREAQAKVIVDMGHNRTSFIILSGGAIVFTTTIALGGKTIEENITRILSVSKEEASRIKKEVGLDMGAYEGRLFEGLIPSLSALADELQRTCEYYRRHTEHVHGATEEIREVLLVGGDALLRGLPTYLASILRIPVALGDPFGGRQKKKNTLPFLSRRHALSYTTALGLSMRAVA